MAQDIAVLTVAQYRICQLLIYNKAIYLSEAHLRKQAKDEEVSLLYKNHTKDLIEPPMNYHDRKRKRVVETEV